MPPPAIDPMAGLTPVTVGGAGLVPAGLLVVYAARPWSDDAVTTDAVCTVDTGVTAVATAVTVTGGRLDPAANGPDEFVHVIVCPDGAAHVQPVPDAPSGFRPAGTVSVTEI